ncbi:exonuclease [Blastocystis sp. subtype 4]|uniref:exonuclease n=1 Tax=Blastocystis sp. subtype 4 TaxID=944170 RepID=UPI0007113E39|nr:exonuclease [Blastocystis sp. subtype 4]KNB46463.1 exonuclease [Blastocystis sp. subtype 4]|eukprot:XP_014529893.1 exonuclease [Blastocystis sp. subtype 4]
MRKEAGIIISGVAATVALSAVSIWWSKKNRWRRILAPCNTHQFIYNRPIFLVHSCEQFETLVEQYHLLDENIIGFDAEWTHNNPLSIVQLTFRNVNIIIQVGRMDHLPPPSLNEMMKNQNILKTGVGIHEDIRKLLKYMIVDEVNGVVDIVSSVQDRDAAHLMGHTDLKTSLQYLTEKYLNVILNKGFKSLNGLRVDPAIRCGNWDEPNLNKDQIHYAASDSYYSREVFVYFYELYRKQTQDALPVLEWVLVNEIEKSISDYDNAGKVRVIVKDANGTHYDDVNMSEINGIKTGGYSKRKRPVYEDCRLLSPDGQLLCRINKKKLDWYVHRGLARTPKNSIKLAATDNICVVCGKSTDYVCHSILPHKYRKYLPEAWKSHNNHDNVILCIPCSIRCNKYDDIYSRRILNTHGFTHNSMPIIVNREVISARKTAGILLRIANGEIHPPNERKLELERELLRFLKKYNCELWMLNESEHDSPKKNDNATYEILSEDEFIKRETNPSDSDSEDNFELSYDEDKQVELVPKNPFADFVLNEEPGVYNFDNELLQKVTHLNAYSIDPEYVAPEELVMRKILSSKNPSISFYL